jgi:hypothetical protein
MRLGMSLTVLGLSALLLGMGCSQDQGTTVTPADAEALRLKEIQGAEKRIAEIQANKDMSPEAKQRAISMIQAGVARAAQGTQAGKAQGNGGK